MLCLDHLATLKQPGNYHISVSAQWVPPPHTLPSAVHIKQVQRLPMAGAHVLLKFSQLTNRGAQ